MMRRYCHPGFFLLLLTTASSFHPLDACSMTLKECVLSAISNSPGLSSERHMISAYSADINKKRATTLPNLSAQLQGYEVNGTPVTQWVPSGVFQPENGIGRRGAHWAPVAIQSVGVTYPILYQGSFLGLNDPPAVAAARSQL